MIKNGLITHKKPKDYSPQDLTAYKNLMVQTNAIYQNDDPATESGCSNKSDKWKNIQKPIWEEEKMKKVAVL